MVCFGLERAAELQLSTSLVVVVVHPVDPPFEVRIIQAFLLFFFSFLFLFHYQEDPVSISHDIQVI